MEEWKAAHGRGELEFRPEDLDQVDSYSVIECCASLFSSGAVCML